MCVVFILFISVISGTPRSAIPRLPASKRCSRYGSHMLCINLYGFQNRLLRVQQPFVFLV